MESDVSSMATVYFTDTSAGAGFTEARTARLPVTVGHNRLCFILKHPHLGKTLRLDPLTCPGDFKLANVSLVQIMG
jgi:hypothetical protein